jgi:hypothetical protein
MYGTLLVYQNTRVSELSHPAYCAKTKRITKVTRDAKLPLKKN